MVPTLKLVAQCNSCFRSDQDRGRQHGNALRNHNLRPSQHTHNASPAHATTLNCNCGRRYDDTWRDHYLRLSRHVFHHRVCFIHMFFYYCRSCAMFLQRRFFSPEYSTFLCSDRCPIQWGSDMRGSTVIESNTFWLR